MSSKDYREIQLTSSQLVIILVGILVLGAVIFLLGISVGKKQIQIQENTGLASKNPGEKVEEKVPAQTQESQDAIRKELATHEKRAEQPQEKAGSEQAQGHYFIQLIALSSKPSALEYAEKYQKQGFNVLVLDPFPSDNPPKYRVRLGGYQTRTLAEKDRDRLMRLESKDEKDYLIIKQ
ncbi:MAG: SPOR domain-containing protein [Candidatus Aminicenantes bacterium]|nr:SPOR domain-containing protein [Candidatus Aminicenantes bacterium]